MPQAFNIYDLYKVMFDNKIILIYQGAFDQEMIKSVVSMTEKKLIQDNANENLRKKLFNIMVEGLQNICKHQLEIDSFENNPFLVITNNEDYFDVVTGNLIANVKIDIVKERIDYVNSLDKEELKEYYKKARLNSVISDVGGAGLGFIDMVRKSGNPLEYKFYDIDDQHSFFIQKTKVGNSN
jgi:hypothetical protein